VSTLAIAGVQIKVEPFGIQFRPAMLGSNSGISAPLPLQVKQPQLQPATHLKYTIDNALSTTTLFSRVEFDLLSKQRVASVILRVRRILLA
jgi:hypothetical protein